MSPFPGVPLRISGLMISLSAALVPMLLPTVTGTRVETASAFGPWWVQSHRETQLWSGTDAQAVSFGLLPQWSRLEVVEPQKGPRLHVFNPATGGYAYVDADSVGPSSPPPIVPDVQTAVSPQPPRQLPKLPAGFEGWWASNFQETELWNGPETGANGLAKVPQFRRFLVVEPQDGDRLKVWSPETQQTGYLDASVLGPSGPSVWMKTLSIRPGGEVNLPGRSVGNKTYIRNLPLQDDETELRKLPNNTPLKVQSAVTAGDGTEWYVVDKGEYIQASEVRLPRPVAGSLQGRWIDADITDPALVTAYEGNQIVYTAMAIKGFAATPTLRGRFQILRRVEDETMDSQTIGIPRNNPGGYLLKHVLYTQYFTNEGASLHYNYWLGTFGYAGSHGCLGLNLDDSKWFWDWATVGTPIIVR